jgi:hypothetical protein
MQQLKVTKLKVKNIRYASLKTIYIVPYAIIKYGFIANDFDHRVYH